MQIVDLNMVFVLGIEKTIPCITLSKKNLGRKLMIEIFLKIYLSGRSSVGSPGYFNPGLSPGRMGARLPSVEVQSPPVVINSPKKEQTRIKHESNLLDIPTEVAR